MRFGTAGIALHRSLQILRCFLIFSRSIEEHSQTDFAVGTSVQLRGTGACVLSLRHRFRGLGDSIFLQIGLAETGVGERRVWIGVKTPRAFRAAIGQVLSPLL